jgi:hypothetical protein
MEGPDSAPEEQVEQLVRPMKRLVLKKRVSVKEKEQQPPPEVLGKKRLVLKKRIQLSLYRLPYDIFFLLFQFLQEADCKSLAYSCKRIAMFYREYVTGTRTQRITDGGDKGTLLYPHQKEILKWVQEQLTLNNKSKLLCNAYMSAGKTVIGYEACFQTMKNIKKEETCFRTARKEDEVYIPPRPIFSIVFCSPNVFPVWVKEAEKHYSHFRTKKDKKILFYTSARKEKREIDAAIFFELMSPEERKAFISNSCNAGQKRELINFYDKYKGKKIERANLEGKVIIMSLQTNSTHMTFDLTKRASFLVYDECHKLQKRLGFIYCKFGHSKPSLFLSASLFTHGEIEIDNIYTLKQNKEMPTLNYVEFDVPSQNQNKIVLPPCVVNDLKTRTDKHIFIITSHVVNFGRIPDLFPRNEITVSPKGKVRLAVNGKRIYSYFRKETRNMARVIDKGGIICSSFKVISEGNNFREFSTAYFVLPYRCTLKTIRQTVGRFYRQNSKHQTINIMNATIKNTQNWARCRLAAINSIGLEGLDAKGDEAVRRVIYLLQENTIDVDTLSDDDLICLFASQVEMGTEQPILTSLKPQLPPDIVLGCMLLK